MKRQKPQINVGIKKGFSALDLFVDADIHHNVVYGYYFDDETVEHLNINGVEISGCVFINCRFLDCFFEGVSFINCYFKNCEISYNHFRQSSFTYCEIVESRMTGINLSQGVLNNVLIRSTDCRLVNFSLSRITVTKFVGCDMTSAAIDKARIKDSEFVQCDLSKMNISGTALTGMDLRGNRLKNIVFTGGELEGTTVDPAQAICIVRLLGIRVAGNETGSHPHDPHKKK